MTKSQTSRATSRTTGPATGPATGSVTGSATATAPPVTVVIPTIGRPSLHETLAAIGPGPDVLVVDDRPGPAGALPPLPVPDGVRVLRSGGRGPAAARNVGWRAATTPWVAFVDDDVVPMPGWADALAGDLATLPADVGGCQGRLEVPLPVHRLPTDAERHTAGLVVSEWITADMAYRRTALEAAGGFDERFPGAYREDCDLALRVEASGFSLVKGERLVRHPVRDDGFWASVHHQRGNASDALMRRVHGPGWRAATGGRPGRLKIHALTTGMGLLAAGLAGAASVQAARNRPASRTAGAAKAAGLAWLGLTAQFAWSRIAPGPRTPEEVMRMVVTSAVIPPVACAHRLRGELAARRGGGS
ncbi:glycosyltransferase family 2 protein [Microbispora sp. NPDC049125]|uniref:glycosyltransferase family 2 protein n=1 Tax=Microbispora sp. NPDC049125 TaxID=3154929 RepID=UPI003465D10F